MLLELDDDELFYLREALIMAIRELRSERRNSEAAHMSRIISKIVTSQMLEVVNES